MTPSLSLHAPVPYTSSARVGHRRREPFLVVRDGAAVLAFSSYGVAGDPPVVLVHGWPLDRSLWSSVATDLAAGGFRVICPDLPGFGRSAPLGPDDWTVEAFADAVAELLDELALDRVPVAGHSFGGYVALALADLQGDRVGGLGLVSSRTTADSEAARAGRKATIERVRVQGTAALLPDLAAKLLAPGASVDLRSRAERMIAACPPSAVIAGLTAMAARPDRGFVLDTFPRPLVVVHGTADQIVPVAEAAQASRPAAVVSRTLLDGVGHLPMWEAVAETTRSLVSWARAAYGV